MMCPVSSRYSTTVESLEDTIGFSSSPKASISKKEMLEATGCRFQSFTITVLFS